MKYHLNKDVCRTNQVPAISMDDGEYSWIQSGFVSMV